MIKIKYFIAVFIFINILAFPQENLLLKLKIDSLLSDPFFQSTTASISIYDLTSRESLFSKNEKLLLNPASNMKILTTGSALLFLEPDYQFSTTVGYTGNIINKILYGDLYVIGQGDPLFYSSDLDSLIKQLKDSGIEEISGNIYGDVSWNDSLFWGSGWMWDDDPSTDAPYLSALNINDNSIEVFVSPSSPGEKADIYLKPPTGYIEIENNTVTTPGNGVNDYEISRDWINRKNRIVVDGFVRNYTIIDSSEVWEGINVYNPAMYFMNLLYEGLLKSGIKVGGIQGISTAPPYIKHLNTLNHSIDSVVVDVNKRSYNLGAEMILRALSVKFSGKPAAAKNGIAVVKNFIDLAGLDPENYRLVDGSGVSRYNLISAELLISMLKYLYLERPEVYSRFFYSLPIAGVDGTLEKRMIDTPAQNNVHAKTGTLSGVSALSGYLTAKNKHQLAFSILIQNYVKSSRTAKGFEDRICEILADYQ